MPKHLSRMISHFSIDLHRELLKPRKDKAENVVSSPYGIAASLSMTLFGARGNTAEELLAALHARDEKIHDQFASFLPKLVSHSHKLQFQDAHRIYSDLKFPVADECAAFLNSTYSSTIMSVDFQNNSENIRAQINDWVKEATESKITDLLAPGSVGPSTSVILVNASYFRGLWESPFPANTTLRRDFHLTAHTKVQVDMMSQKQDFAITHNDELAARAIEMPYKGGRASMVILLPDAIDGLSNLERHISHSKLSDILADFKETPNVQLSMPKLLLQQSFSLKDTFQGMGVNDLFSAKCDLSGMFKSGNPCVSDIIHKAYLQVDEEGTEAAAATAVTGCGPCGPGATQTTEFIVDHPFMLFVFRSKSDVVLFMGSVRHP
ncbi:iris-like [Dermacentor variabilis]|uniref:iris-like n=1 Tax=Dermacentor variabilis TaxID=34621 RepID=UPI003F5C26F1